MASSSHKSFALYLALVSVLFTSTLGCEASQQEQEIHAAIEQGVLELEQGNVKQIFKMSTKDLIAYPGRLNRTTLVTKLHLMLRNQGEIAISHPAPEIELDESGESAVVNMPFAVTRPGEHLDALDDFYEDPDAWLALAKEQLEVQNVELSVVKQRDRWLVQTVRVF